MEANRGKKGKKGRWQLTLGAKEAVFAGLGVLGLITMSFALGTLAGRGDIYRVLSHWGLLAPDAVRVAQWASPGAPPTLPGPAAPVAQPAPPGSATTAAKPVAGTPVTGSLAAVPDAASPQKKSKGGSALHREQRAKEEEIRKVRQEVVPKLKFQNSLDTAAKPPHTAQKQKEKGAAKGQPAQVKVVQYRELKAAKAKMAELKKKGMKVSLKESRDDQGPLYTIYKQAPPSPPDQERVAQKPKKPAEKKPKPQED